MKALRKVTDVPCPICRNKPGRMCTDRSIYASGPKFTVKAHAERYDELKRQQDAASGQQGLAQ